MISDSKRIELNAYIRGIKVTYGVKVESVQTIDGAASSCFRTHVNNKSIMTCLVNDDDVDNYKAAVDKELGL